MGSVTDNQRYLDFLRVNEDPKTLPRQRSYIFHKWLFHNWDEETLQVKAEGYALRHPIVQLLKSLERVLFNPFSDYIEASRAARDILEERAKESTLVTT